MPSSTSSGPLSYATSATAPNRIPAILLVYATISYIIAGLALLSVVIIMMTSIAPAMTWFGLVSVAVPLFYFFHGYSLQRARHWVLPVTLGLSGHQILLLIAAAPVWINLIFSSVLNQRPPLVFAAVLLLVVAAMTAYTYPLLTPAFRNALILQRRRLNMSEYSPRWQVAPVTAGIIALCMSLLALSTFINRMMMTVVHSASPIYMYGALLTMLLGAVTASLCFRKSPHMWMACMVLAAWIPASSILVTLTTSPLVASGITLNLSTFGPPVASPIANYASLVTRCVWLAAAYFARPYFWPIGQPSSVNA